MSRIMEYRWVSVGSPQSRIQFGTEGDAAWPVWDRYILLDGKRAYRIGNICNTCSFIFERMDGANDRVDVKDAAAALQNGLHSISESIVERIAEALPEDDYLVFLVEILPQLVRPGQPGDYFCQEHIALWGLDSFYGLPHNPRVPYYRVGEHDLGNGARKFEFLVPMFPDRWLDWNSVRRYKDLLDSGNLPTAVALSVLDVKGPAEASDQVVEHWCLAHYLLDGHHKVFAAAESGHCVQLLAFVSCSKGISSREQVARILE